jgi:hypothetical protein
LAPIFGKIRTILSLFPRVSMPFPYASKFEVSLFWAAKLMASSNAIFVIFLPIPPWSRWEQIYTGLA